MITLSVAGDPGGPDRAPQIREGSGQGSGMGTIYWKTSAMF